MGALIQVNYDNLRTTKDESQRSSAYREELGKFQAKIQDHPFQVKDQPSVIREHAFKIVHLKKKILKAIRARHVALEKMTARLPGFARKWVRSEVAW